VAAAAPLVAAEALRQLPDGSYELISNELLLDGQARLNLATFVTTWMPSIAGELMAETADKNMIDKDEYPQTAESRGALRQHHRRPVARPRREHATGCSTTGSSEAAMLGRAGAEVALARADAAAGKPTDRRTW
jgi:glutamate decarboxylase